MSSFERLHPALQHHIVNSLGWSSLRPLQEATIDPILSAHHAILLAPTAGGKTEAAVFPVFSRMLSEDWSGLSVLYICPIKALLNNLEARLDGYASLLGRRVALWHGDVGPSRKAKILADPPDLLLTTPESIEVMLVSRRVDHRRLFANLRCVIIDEVHAFAGDDRGWHLLFLLERLSRLAGREIQRLGLSATVGNPQGLCDWLAEGTDAPREVINPPAAASAEPDVEVDWVGNLNNAALVISRLHRGEKRLVFCDSRSRVEELSLMLRNLGVDTYVSHSSLSLEARRAAEEAFAQGDDCAIIATSTLELGIDVGDLDRVIQIDAPSSVASFLQRIGRAGRRGGSKRNCLFLTTKQDAFLQCLALMQLWVEDYVEPIVPPPLPLHLFAQQIMALSLQEGGIGRADWQAWFRRLPGLDGLGKTDLEHVIDGMLSRGILHQDQGVLSMGGVGEAEYGSKNFLELFSVFITPPVVKVMYGKQELGEVHRSTFLVKDSGPSVLTLAGRSWETKHIDWGRRIAYVEPTDIKGRSQWLSANQPLPFELCQAIVRALESEHPPVRLTRRASEYREELQEDFAWVESGSTFLVTSDQQTTAWWTFGGALLNTALGVALADELGESMVDNLAIRFKPSRDSARALSAIKRLLRERAGSVFLPLDEAFVDELKFGECLSAEHAELVLHERYNLEQDIQRMCEFTIKKTYL